MKSIYKTPGVYIEEISKLPLSVAEVETAIPAFIGYTQKAQKINAGDLFFIPAKVTSLSEYENYFGKAASESFDVLLKENTTTKTFSVKISRDTTGNLYRMYYALKMFFNNGGGKCYIISTGNYSDNIGLGDVAIPRGLLGGLSLLEKEDEPTIIVVPDAIELSPNDYKVIYEAALTQCKNLRDRFTIIDLYNDTGNVVYDSSEFRKTISLGTEFLKYGAAYYPRLLTSLNYFYDESKVKIKSHLDQNGKSPSSDLTGKSLDSEEIKLKRADLYYMIIKELNNSEELRVVLPPSSTIAGIYVNVDNSRGVWKAPANVTLNSVIKPTVVITDQQQNDLNVDTIGGKSINAIRSFIGKGTLVWGARTLAGNDNEWRYISVRRFFNMVEESVTKSTAWVVFEPNDANTWTKVRSLIENYLTLKWRDGALAGAKPDEAFFVKCGLGQTMTSQDILNGLLIVEIGMAVVRPAEFIILRFSHKMQKS